MEHEEGEGVSVRLRHLTDGLEELRDPISEVGVGGCLGEDVPHAGGHQGGLQVPQEVLHDSSEGVDVVPGEVGTSSGLQELVSESTDLRLRSRNSVDADLAQTAGLDLVEAVDDDGGNHRGGERGEVGQVSSSVEGGPAGSLVSRAHRDTGHGQEVSTVRVTDGPTLPALVTRLPEPDPPPARPASLSLGGEVFLLDEDVFPVHPGVAAGPDDGVGGGVRRPGQGGCAGVGRGECGRASQSLYHRHLAHTRGYSSPGVFPAEKNIVKTSGPREISTILTRR